MRSPEWKSSWPAEYGLNTFSVRIYPIPSSYFSAVSSELSLSASFFARLAMHSSPCHDARCFWLPSSIRPTDIPKERRELHLCADLCSCAPHAWRGTFMRPTPRMEVVFVSCGACSSRMHSILKRSGSTAPVRSRGRLHSCLKDREEQNMKRGNLLSAVVPGTQARTHAQPPASASSIWASGSLPATSKQRAFTDCVFARTHVPRLHGILGLVPHAYDPE